LENLFVSINVIVPLVLLIALGYFLKHSKFLSEAVFGGINKLVFTVLLPSAMFQNIISSNKEAIFELNTLGFCLIVFLIFAIVCFLIVLKFEKDPRKQGVLCLSHYLVNLMVIGMPIMISLYPGQDIGPAMVLFAIFIPLTTFFSILSLQILSQKNTNFLLIGKNFIRNPFVIASILAFILLFTGIRLPQIIGRAVANVASASMPISIIALGASFSLPAIKENKWQLIITTIVKLFILPAAAIFPAYHFGFRGVELAAIMVLFGCPTGTGSYSMAVVLGGDPELSSQSVLITNVFSIISFFFWIFLLASMNAL
jgi:predicted permease